MKNKQDEKMFDDSIHSRLESATEEVPEYLWKSISGKSKKRKGLLWFFGSLTGFLFHDILIAAFVVLLAGANPSFSDNVKDTSVVENKNSTDYSAKAQMINADEPVNTKVVVDESRTSVETNNENKFSDKSISAKENNTTTSTQKNIQGSSISKSKRSTNIFREKKRNEISSSSSTLAVSSDQLLSVKTWVDKINDRQGREIVYSIESRQLMLDNKNEDKISSPENKKVKARPALPVSIRMGAGTVYDISKIESEKILNNQTKTWMNKTNAFLIADMRFANNWLLTAGIHQQESQIDVEVIDVASFNYWDTDTVTGFIISPFHPPVPFTFYDSSLVNSLIEKNYSGTIDVKFVSASLQVERSLHKGAFDFRLGAGIGINIYSKSKGSLVLKDSEEHSAISMDNAFKKSIQPLLIALFETGYYLGGMFEPFIRIQYNTSFNNLMENKNILKYKSQSVAGSVGLRIRITK